MPNFYYTTLFTDQNLHRTLKSLITTQFYSICCEYTGILSYLPLSWGMDWPYLRGNRCCFYPAKYARHREGQRGAARKAEERPQGACEEVEKQPNQRRCNPFQALNEQLEGFPTYTLRHPGQREEEQPELLPCAELRKWLEENSPASDPVPKPNHRFALAS